MNVHIITVGDEILIGQIVDTNSAWMGQQLNEIGLAVGRIVTVADQREDIVRALDQSLAEADVILMTGGLGPTKDDVTKKTLADYFGTKLVFHEESWERLSRFFAQLKRTPLAAHRAQCHLPLAAEILTNSMGTAPGMWFERDGKVVMSMPGVPYEMKHLMERWVLPRLGERSGTTAIVHRTLSTAGQGESFLAQRVEDIEAELPGHIKLAFLPNLGRVRLRLSGTGTDRAVLEGEVNAFSLRIQKRLQEYVYSTLDEPLEVVLGQLLRDKGLSMATAESCTGGRIAAQIVAVSGASDYFKGGIVAYDNAVKHTQLGVATETLEKHGAVSEATVREMVQGTLSLLQVDVAVAASGIAGPGGGTPDKPVGTIWLAVGNAERTDTYLVQAGKDRRKNIEYAANLAINLMIRFIKIL